MIEPRGQWLSTSEAAAALRCSERTVQRRAKAGTITARKITDGDGEKWEVQLSADSGAKGVPPSGATGADRPNERERASVTPQIGDGADRVTPEVPTGDATGETVFLRAQLDAMNAALEREQRAHEQTRQLLAGALQMASRQLPNVTQPPAPERDEKDVVSKDNTATGDSDQRPSNRRGDGLALVRDGLKRLFGR